MASVATFRIEEFLDPKGFNQLWQACAGVLTLFQLLCLEGTDEQPSMRYHTIQTD